MRCEACGYPTALWQQLHVVGIELREGVRRGFFEPRKPAAKHELYHVGRAVTLLGDSKLRLFSLFRRRTRFEKMRPVDEHHHVRVLLDGSRFAQIGELWPALIEPASSIHSGADEIVPSDSVMRRQSSRLRCPVRNLCVSICATDATRRCSSDSLDISRLNIATGCPPRIAMFSIKFSASAVFPCEGRAARIKSSEGCNPDVSLSSSV